MQLRTAIFIAADVAAVYCSFGFFGMPRGCLYSWNVEGSDGFKNGCEINDRCETIASDVHCSTLYEIEISKQSVV